MDKARMSKAEAEAFVKECNEEGWDCGSCDTAVCEAYCVLHEIDQYMGD